MQQLLKEYRKEKGEERIKSEEKDRSYFQNFAPLRLCEKIK